MSADRTPLGHGRGATVALAVTVVLGTVLLLWGAERLARWGAESVLARTVQQQTGVLERPEVQVHGGAVLLQALRGRYDSVEIGIDTLSSGPVRLRDHSAELEGVYLSFHDLLDGNVDRVFVERSVEQALLTHGDLDRYLRFAGRPLESKPAGEGQLQFTGTIDVDGGARPVSAVAEVAGEDGALLVRPVRVDTPAALDGFERLLLEQRFTFPVPLDPLLFGGAAVDVAVRPDGLAIRSSGSAVLLGS